ncbi:MAG: nucleotide sugar dehydrogenase, partial [Desulfosalsimonadaceae bacterium]
MKNPTIAVIGLGYVGLPLAVAFGRHFTTIGYDIKPDLIDRLRRFEDPTGELSGKELKSAVKLTLTGKPDAIAAADFIIVATPTPIDIARQPDLGPLTSATKTAGRHMKKGAVVVFESTVYPGVTEEICVPLLEENSGYTWKRDFFVGYSPERINPGDKAHTLQTIIKVVAGDTPETLEMVAQLYDRIVDAGVFRTATIKEAEAAKVIENTQRDLNIALMNELALIFDKIGIDTQNVLAAAGSKWNFLPFRPGLVGGHCIGVDPYYLTHKAETLGYLPQVILAGRRINDNMGKFVAEKAVKLMCGAHINIRDARVAIFGLTFKENCADTRNTRVVDINTNSNHVRTYFRNNNCQIRSNLSRKQHCNKHLNIHFQLQHNFSKQHLSLRLHNQQLSLQKRHNNYSQPNQLLPPQQSNKWNKLRMANQLYRHKRKQSINRTLLFQCINRPKQSGRRLLS